MTTANVVIIVLILISNIDVAVGFSSFDIYEIQCLQSIGCKSDGSKIFSCNVPYVPHRNDSCLEEQSFDATSISLDINLSGGEGLLDDAIKLPSVFSIKDLSIGGKEGRVRSISENALRFVKLAVNGSSIRIRTKSNFDNSTLLNAIRMIGSSTKDPGCVETLQIFSFNLSAVLTSDFAAAINGVLCKGSVEDPWNSTVDISGVDTIATNALGNLKLNKLKINADSSENGCTIARYAFQGSAMRNVELHSVIIGDSYAFSNCTLYSLSFKHDALVQENAFDNFKIHHLAFSKEYTLSWHTYFAITPYAPLDREKKASPTILELSRCNKTYSPSIPPKMACAFDEIICGTEHLETSLCEFVVQDVCNETICIPNQSLINAVAHDLTITGTSTDQWYSSCMAGLRSVTFLTLEYGLPCADSLMLHKDQLIYLEYRAPNATLPENYTILPSVPSDFTNLKVINLIVGQIPCSCNIAKELSLMTKSNIHVSDGLSEVKCVDKSDKRVYPISRWHDSHEDQCAAGTISYAYNRDLCKTRCKTVIGCLQSTVPGLYEDASSQDALNCMAASGLSILPTATTIVTIPPTTTTTLPPTTTMPSIPSTRGITTSNCEVIKK